MVRPPFSRRNSDLAAEEFFVLREGVPAGLTTTLLDFAADWLYPKDDRGFPLKQSSRSRIQAFARVTDIELDLDEGRGRSTLAADKALLLDAVDFVLDKNLSKSATRATNVMRLSNALIEARSIYTVGVDAEEHLELQLRQPEELTATVVQATSVPGRSAEHLRRAWSEAFGIEGNPTTACFEATKALEVAAKPVVSPSNSKATLGTIIQDLKNKPTKWTTESESIADIEQVISMMQMVWWGYYRHGDQDDPIDVSPIGAEMVVQLSAVLVHWFQSKFIRQRNADDPDEPRKTV